MTIPRWLLMFLSLCLKITNKWPVDSTKVIYNKMKEVNVRHSLNESKSRRWWCERIRHKEENKIKRRNTPKRETSWEKSSSERRDHEKWKYAFFVKRERETGLSIVLSAPRDLGTDAGKEVSDTRIFITDRQTAKKRNIIRHQRKEPRGEIRSTFKSILRISKKVFLSDQFFFPFLLWWPRKGHHPWWSSLLLIRESNRVLVQVRGWPPTTSVIRTERNGNQNLLFL